MMMRVIVKPIGSQQHLRLFVGDGNGSSALSFAGEMVLSRPACDALLELLCIGHRSGERTSHVRLEVQHLTSSK
jgi:hypothetical protein